MRDFHHRAMDDGIGDSSPKKGRFELLRFLEFLRPLAARCGKSEVGTRGHIPGRLEHRWDFCHEPRLQCRDRIRFRSRPARHILEQASLLGSGRHALAMDRIEPAERIGHWQHATRQTRQPFKVLPNARGKAIVAYPIGWRGVTKRVVYCRCGQCTRRFEEGIPGLQSRCCAMLGNRNDPASVFHRHQYRVHCQSGRIRLRQDELPGGWCIIGNRHDSRRVAEIDADFCFRRPLPAESVERCQCQCGATGRVHHEIRLYRLRSSGPEVNPNTLHGGIARGRYETCYAALRPQRNVRDCFGPAAQHQLDQRSRGTEQRYAEVPLRQDANICPLELDLMCDLDGDSARSRQIPLEARENLPRACRPPASRPCGCRSWGVPGREAADAVRWSRSKISTRSKCFAKAPAIDSPPIPAPTTTARRPKISLMTLCSHELAVAAHRTLVTVEFQPERNALHP